MRRLPAALLSLFCSLPTVGSLLVIASMPPLSQALPAPLLAWVRSAAALPFELVAALPPDSLAGRLFYGTYEPLIPIFGAHALVVHSALLGLPWLIPAVWLARRALRRSPSRSDPRPASAFLGLWTRAP